jgi:hypothetical protein
MMMCAELRNGHVVEQEHVHAVEREKITHLVEGRGFELDAGAGAFGAQAVDVLLQGLQAGIGRVVVVLGHGVVVETHAVIRGPTVFDGGFFEQTPSWSGFAGIPDLDRVRFDGLDVAARLCGDAAEALEEIQGGALGGEQAARASGGFEQDAALLEGLTVADEDFDLDIGIDLVKNGLHDFHARDDSGLAGHNLRAGARLCRDEVFGGHVTRADVFGDGGVDESESAGVHAAPE